MIERNPIIEARIQKVREMREKGINPFPNKFTPTHTTADIIANGDKFVEEKKEVNIAGRVLTIRKFGKASFFHLQDGYDKVQVYVKQGEADDASAALFVDFVAAGDFIGIYGPVFRTKTNELTIVARKITVLTKAFRPLPEKWHGLQNTELRYRQRYLDLVVNTDVKKTFETRSKIVSAMRQYLDGRGYLEVETPMMHPVYGGANARPFITHHNTLDMELYLRIAPELYLKRLVVGGFEKVYEINRNFRNEGISTRHNPEFTMLELYTAWWDYTDTMDLVEEMLKFIAEKVLGSLKFAYQEDTIDLEPKWRRVTMLNAIKETCGVEFSWADNLAEAKAKAAGIQGIEGIPGNIKTSAELIVFIFESIVEPNLVQPTFITEFPKSLSPLSKTKADDPLVAERFEFFMGKLETGNAYSELNDPEDQFDRFKEQVAKLEAGDSEATMMDEDYITALEQGMPPTSGLGIGIDRIVMLFTNSLSIRDVILFPLMRPKTIKDEEEENTEEAEQPEGTEPKEG